MGIESTYVHGDDRLWTYEFDLGDLKELVTHTDVVLRRGGLQLSPRYNFIFSYDLPESYKKDALAVGVETKDHVHVRLKVPKKEDVSAQMVVKDMQLAV